MKLMHFAGVSAVTLALVAGGGLAATAQETQETSFSASILAGSCADMEQDAVVRLADLTYGLGEEAGIGDTAGAMDMEMLGGEGTVPVATGVTRLEMTAAESVSAPHAVAIYTAGSMDAADAVACGVIGGMAPQENLFFGLQEENGSGYAGVGWLNETGDTTLLTVMVTSLDATTAMPVTSAPAPAGATPATSMMATPEPAAEMATPNAMIETATPDTMMEMATPMAATPSSDATGTTETSTESVLATPAQTTPAAGASPAADAGAAQDAAAETVTIESVDIDFIPDEVTIPADTDVTIMLPNNGVTLHTFVINEHNNEDVPNLDIFVEMAPGATEQVTINAPAGEYYYWCDIPGHEAAGMFGTLIVE